MATHDLGHTLTDKKLRDLERRIARLYAQAGRELQSTIDAYFDQFAKRDEEMKALIGEIANGKEWTEQDYKQWRLAQIGRGERYQALRERIAQRMTNANAVAIAYINDETPGVYSLNRNYAAYTIEQVAGNVGFDLWDEQTVRRLIVEQPELMPSYPPARALRRGIDLAYGRRQITASVTSSILQGRSLRGIADDLQQRITTMDRTSAVRTARTAFTGAQNAGRMDSYAAAEQMGIKLKKEWLATLDGRTRHSHAALDGEKVGTDEKFSNGCRFPGDPQGRPGEVYNCRCTMVAALDDVDTSGAQRRARNPETGESVLIPNMTYKEWEAWKKSENATAWDTFIKKGRNYSADKKQWQEFQAVLGKKIPNNIADFQRLKYNEPEKWNFVKLDKKRRDALRAHPERALPGEKKTAATEKFTKYLFNPDNPQGWAKGAAFSSRLGYTAENYADLRREIISGARRYPAVNKGDNGFGVRYEQKMILYGKTGNPANVTVGWIYKDGVARMTTAYISEV